MSKIALFLLASTSCVAQAAGNTSIPVTTEALCSKWQDAGLAEGTFKCTNVACANQSGNKKEEVWVYEIVDFGRVTNHSSSAQPTHEQTQSTQNFT